MCDQFRVAVLASGSGTNLQALIDAFESGGLKGLIALVISDNNQAYALERASKHNIPAHYIGREDFESREEYEMEMVKVIKDQQVDLVLLAGFMRILSPKFLEHFSGQIMNIHPSLLPAFKGLDAQGQALEYGAKISGCTVHFVDEGMDTGPIILQAAVPVLADDSRDDLAKRILKEEHRIYPEAVKLYQEGRLKRDGRHVIQK